MKSMLKYIIPLGLVLMLSYFIFKNREGYDKLENYFARNENNLVKLSSLVYSQNNVKFISRKSPSYCFPLTLISENRNSYYFLTVNNERIGIEVHDKSFEDFLNSGFENVEDGYSGKKINLILRESKIPENEIMEILRLMNESNLSSVWGELNGSIVKYVKLLIDQNEGLLFDQSGILEEFESDIVIRKGINGNWFYLYEKNY